METQVLTITDLTSQEQAINTAVALLADGHIVGFPTETVYGVAAQVDSDAGWQALSRLKQRPSDKPFTCHVGEVNDIFRLVPLLSEKQKRFIRKTLPGPLTIVFDLNQQQIQQVQNNTPEKVFQRLYFNNSIGIRLPDDRVARRLLSQAKGPVVASSANPAGMPPAYTAEQTLAYLNGHISLIIDNGPSKIQKPSTVVKIAKGKFEILREGIIDNRMINKALEMNILFVCTGNTCRSPMAKGFGRSIIAKKLDCTIDQIDKRGYHVESAGVMALEGSPASIEAVEACRSFGVDISDHRSKQLTENLIKDADFILALSPGHYRSIVSLVPEAAGKTELLSPGGISDPYGMSQDVYDSCAKQIKQAVELFADKLGID